MFHPFSGTVSGNGLQPTTVQGEIDAVYVAGSKIKVAYHQGKFLWNGSHQFKVGEEYTLEMEIGGAGTYAIGITDIRPGLVEFKTR